MKLLSSKTIWFNLITLVLAMVNQMRGNIIPEDIAVAIIALGNVMIRLFKLALESQLIKELDKLAKGHVV